MSAGNEYRVRVDARDEREAIEIAQEGLSPGSKVVNAQASRLDADTFEVSLFFRKSRRP